MRGRPGWYPDPARPDHAGWHEPIAVPAPVVGTVVLGLNLYVSISG